MKTEDTKAFVRQTSKQSRGLHGLGVGGIPAGLRSYSAKIPRGCALSHGFGIYVRQHGVVMGLETMTAGTGWGWGKHHHRTIVIVKYINCKLTR